MNHRRIDCLHHKIRWRIARVSDRHDVCWSSLAMWAIYPEDHPFSEIFHMTGSARQCQLEAKQHGQCYCGKFDETAQQENAIDTA